LGAVGVSTTVEASKKTAMMTVTTGVEGMDVMIAAFYSRRRRMLGMLT
jgi:hypothetical protein